MIDLDIISLPDSVRDSIKKLSKDITIDKISNKGANSYVFLGKNNISGQPVAIKYYYWGGDKKYHAEPRQLAEINCKYIIKILLRPDRFFGIVKDWIDEMPFMVTDREKTIIDGLDLPQYVGGVAEIAKALSTVWTQLNESKLRKYAVKIGNSAVAKRLGFIMEMLKLGDVERLRKVAVLAPGFSPLDPTLPRKGKYNRRWGLLVNMSL